MDIQDHHRPIRVGIVIEGNAPFRAWHGRLLKELKQLAGIQFSGIKLDTQSRPPAFGNAIESAAFRFDNMLTRRQEIETTPHWQDLTNTPGAEGIVGDVDVVLDLRADPTNPNPISRTAQEVWSVDFLRGPTSPEGAGMRVALTGNGSFPITLERVASGAFERIDQAVCAGRRSAARNLEQAQQVAVAMILRSLRGRVQGGSGRALNPSETPPDFPEAGGKDRQSKGQALRYAGNFVSYAAGRSADTVVRKLSLLSGTLAPHFRLYHGHGRPIDFAPQHSRALEKSRHHYLADPFLFRRDGRLWAFFEVYDYQTATGRIGVAELTKDGLGSVQTVLAGDDHLSYPHVFEHDGEVYMMPETCARRRLEMWRAVKFPNEWELVSTALEGAVAVDSNLYNDGSRWWLFTNSTFDPACDAGLELNVFEVDGPALKSFTPHTRNPVVADARYSRNGGRVFQQDGRLYRPAQSLEYGTYGYGLYIMEVLRLSLDEYEERPVRFIRGCHHIDSNESDVIFDMRRGVSPEQSAAAGSAA